jgi:hypothetical protein
MTSKMTLTSARKNRESSLILFNAACEDLEEDTDTTTGKQLNERRVKSKLAEVKTTYIVAVDAQAEVVSIEKISSNEESNRTWVRTNLSKPYKTAVERAETALESLGKNDDPEAEEKVKTAEAKRQFKSELVRMEADLKNLVEGLEETIGGITIWLEDNHDALSGKVEELRHDLNKVHMQKGENYMKFLDSGQIETEVKRQEDLRGVLGPKLASLQITLLGKKPKRAAALPGVPSQQHQVRLGNLDAAQGNQTGVQIKPKVKFKMAAMAIPKFSGKVVDYPEWRKLFKDCVESQYEESAAVMTLRNQALPADLVSLVPRCAELATVWEKLDKRFLDPSRVWKGVKADLRNLDRKKLGNLKYMAELVSKLVDAENLLETVGMVQWLRQEDKIPEYEDMLIESERLEWVKMRPSLTGTPWENFRAFLLKMRDWYEEVSKTGTQDFESEEDSSKKKTCDYCNRRDHLEKDCFQKKRWLTKREILFQVWLRSAHCQGL